MRACGNSNLRNTGAENLTSEPGASFQVRLHPRARKNAIIGTLGDAIKVSVAAPPIQGKANAACIELLANLLNVPRASVTIASGQNSRNKMIRVSGIAAQELRERLHLALRK